LVFAVILLFAAVTALSDFITASVRGFFRDELERLRGN